MTSFFDEFQKYRWDEIRAFILSRSVEDVEKSLNKVKRSVWDFATLLSPAAEDFLAPMATEASRLTRKRFGKSMQLYVPLYLSNECTNVCTYCGFSMENKIPRKTLSPEEINREIQAIKEMGFDHILIVTGEANSKVGVDYLKKAVKQVRPYFSQISLEVQPLETKEYAELRQSGMSAVMVYQETYHQAEYKKHHPKGKKSVFKYRLETPDRLGQAGVEKVGLGALLGLEDWRVDSFFTALHLDYLEKTYWKTKYSISFPRLRPHTGGLEPKVEMRDRQLVQLICAWRLFREEVEISLSTRESSAFRDGVMEFGITTMSAASRTDPGGYALGEQEELEQFSISDERSAEEVARQVAEKGFQPVWKDWDISYDQAR